MSLSILRSRILPDFSQEVACVCVRYTRKIRHTIRKDYKLHHGDQLIQPPLRSLLSNILELRHDMNTRRTCKTVSCFPITNLARIKIVAERSRSIETRRVNNHTLQTLFLKLNFLSYPPPSPRLIQISKIHFMDFYGTPRTRKSRFYLSSAHRLLSMNQRKFFPNV